MTGKSKATDGALTACKRCNGSGTVADYVGDDMRCIETGCPDCKGTGLAALPPPTGEPVAWRWRLPSDTKWQFADGPDEPRLGLPTSFEASAIKEPVYAAPLQVEPAEGEIAAKAWLEKHVAKEGDSDPTTGDPTTAMKWAEMERLATEALPQWAQNQLLSLRRKVEETEAERDVFQGLLKEEFRVSADRAEQIMALKRKVEEQRKALDEEAHVIAVIEREFGSWECDDADGNLTDISSLIVAERKAFRALAGEQP